MRTIEYCLDTILNNLQDNWSRSGAEKRKFLLFENLLIDFELPEFDKKHEFVKGLIDKLVEDGYAEFRDPPTGSKPYGNIFYEEETLITVRGYFFLKTQNGYQGEKQKSIAHYERIFDLENRQDRMAKRLFWINLSIAIATGVAALYYLTKLYWEHHWFWALYPPYSCP